MARLHFVKKARKDYPEKGIKKGDSYYWWANRITIGKSYRSIKHMQKNRPMNYELIQSPFLKEIARIDANIQSVDNNEMSISDMKDIVEEAKSDLEALRDETQGNLDNMPEGLQSGSLLEERVGYLEEMIDELNNLDLDDEDAPRVEIIDNIVAVCYNGG